MLTRTRNKTINQLMSSTESFLSHAEGNDVAVLKTESSNFHESLLKNGFTQNIKKDGFNAHYGHSAYWNEASQLLVSFAGNNLWTIATENEVLKASTFYDSE